ncbi:hypothetical protein ABDD95_20705 [Mucilaginibacter sp. PAMB04274]|uniref:hypothetical protein n=1 Tax=Mucilaginibacter sp. PAMB04274 TaxID=3138568 RepID=UPI0031F65A23
MNGTTSQLLSLITYGNHFLRTGQLTHDYYPDNTAFKFCNKTDFLYLSAASGGAAMEEVAATDPVAWFELIKKDGCRILKAYYHPSKGNPDGTPDHQLAGFVGGGGTWLIEAIYPSWSDYWAPRWVVTHKDDPERRIWSVSYGRTISRSDTINFCPDIVPVHDTLYDVLIEIKAFAVEHQLSNWANIFNNAIDLLNGSKPASNLFGGSVNENDYDQPALRLLYAAMSSDVFGGMGSWNDLGFEKPEENQRYGDLSYSLYGHMNRALLSSINSIEP